MGIIKRIVIKIYHGIKMILIMIVFFLSFPIAYLIYGRKKYWLISEVDFDARDNGIHFFKYLNKYHKEINSIYLISKNNPNYEYVKNIGEVLEPNTYKHMLIYIASKAKISTLVHGCSPSGYITEYYLLKHHPTGKNIALKHGVFKNLHNNYFKENAHLDLICCGAKPEYDFINNNFHYDKGVVRYTGLARFDGLHNLELKKEIFIMPTWRRWLDDIKDRNDFENSDYYQNWFSLLNSNEFKKIAKENNLEICFYVHPKLNRFIESFNGINDIKFLNSKAGDDVQTHLKQAMIMITDFSSVFFDFAYMRKPAIYFQFDEDRYYESHYVKAYFDYRDNGFGEVNTKYNEVVLSLKSIISNHISIEDKYLQRANDFFPLYDEKNCERIYNAIMEIINE